MTAIVPLQLRATVSHRSEAAEHLRAPGDAVLIRRGRPRWLLLSCPCGCGEVMPVNLDERAGPAWHLYDKPGAGVSLFPSVWRESGCRSHFIIWRNRIWLLGAAEAEFDVSFQPGEEGQLATAVYERLPSPGLVPYADIAAALNAVPWDVLKVLRQLQKAGRVREGIGKQRNWFGRR